MTRPPAPSTKGPFIRIVLSSLPCFRNSRCCGRNSLLFCASFIGRNTAKYFIIQPPPFHEYLDSLITYYQKMAGFSFPEILKIQLFVLFISSWFSTKNGDRKSVV